MPCASAGQLVQIATDPVIDIYHVIDRRYGPSSIYTAGNHCQFRGVPKCLLMSVSDSSFNC